jgi:hypothetical protein
VQRNYDQTKTWRELMNRANAVGANPPDITELALSAAAGLTPLLKDKEVSTIIHLVFNKNVVPQGGILYNATMTNGKMGPNPDQLASLGYELKDGKVEMVDEVPVGPAYGVLNYWGGDKQHKRWHMSEPVTIDPSRNGDMFFMDDNMIAFGVKWKDGDRVEESLLELLGLFERGVGGTEHIAQPLVIEIVAQIG